MKIALLQDEIYVPTLGGGTKANRCLLECLAKRGHVCQAWTRALTESPDGPRSVPELVNSVTARGATLVPLDDETYSYQYRNVSVEALNHADAAARQARLAERLSAFRPDCVFVADDKRRFLLPAALQAAPDRVVLLFQTIVQFPFGPLAVQPDQGYAQLMAQCQALVVISQFAHDYVVRHSPLRPRVLPIPVYGHGPFPDWGRDFVSAAAAPPTPAGQSAAAGAGGFVTMINPCDLKGLPIFLELARRLPKTAFAAVPTWGANADVLARLQTLPNMTILPATDDIDAVLQRTRILIVPSLWPETFGYVVPEAMARGIPVLASRIGGLPEAKLGVDYLLDVRPGVWAAGQFSVPPQDVDPWLRALRRLLADPEHFARCSRESRAAALRFIGSVTVEPFVELAATVAHRAGHAVSVRRERAAPGDKL